jgi:hypothetical protein
MFEKWVSLSLYNASVYGVYEIELGWELNPYKTALQAVA